MQMKDVGLNEYIHKIIDCDKNSKWLTNHTGQRLSLHAVKNVDSYLG